MTEDFDYEAHERLRGRVANEADSVLWTYKAYYEGADWYAKRDRHLDWLVFGISALLTTALIWGEASKILLIGLAIVSSVIVGYRRMASPGNHAENYYRAGDAYHRLFDEFRDFIQLELADDSDDLEEMKSRYRELASRRRNLNEDMSDVTSKWYDRLDDSVYDEVSTTEQAKKKLTGGSKLLRPDASNGVSGEEAKDRIAGNAELDGGERL